MSAFENLPLEARERIEQAVRGPYLDYQSALKARATTRQELQRAHSEAQFRAADAARALEEATNVRDSDRAYVARLEAEAAAAKKRLDNFTKEKAPAYPGITPDDFDKAARQFKGPYKLRAPIEVRKGATLESVRQSIAEAYGKIESLKTAALTLEEAKQRVRRTFEREMAKLPPIGSLGEAFRVRYRDDGKPREEGIDLKLDVAMMHGIRGHMLAAIDSKLESLFERRYAFENPISLKARAKKIEKLNADIAALEVEEGQLLRDAIAAGQKVTLRPDTRDLAAVLFVEPDAEEIARQTAASAAAVKAA